MDFDHTEERQMLQDTLRRFFKDKYTPQFREKIVESDLGYSAEIWKELADLGIIGMLFSEADGGYGGGGFDLTIVFEEIGRVCALEPFLQTGVLGGGLVAALGNEEQKKILEGVIAGSTHLALAHSEPTSRYELSRVSTKAVKTDDGYVLSGQKSVVYNGHSADHLIVSARLSGAVDDEKGIGLFLVPKDHAGLSVRSYPIMEGGAASDLILDNVALPKAALLGAEQGSFQALEKQIARAITAICSNSVGAMESAKDLTLEYLRTRKQFGVPIGKFQALQHRMADLLIEIEQARSSVVNAASNLEQGREIREKYVSAAKNLTGRAGKLVADESVQLHGGIGMTAEYELANFAKTLIMNDHKFGDVDHHLGRFIRFAKAEG